MALWFIFFQYYDNIPTCEKFKQTTYYEKQKLVNRGKTMVISYDVLLNIISL